MFLKNRYSRELKEIKQIIKPIKFKNIKYYQVLMKGEKIPRLVEKDLVIKVKNNHRRRAQSNVKGIIFDKNFSHHNGRKMKEYLKENEPSEVELGKDEPLEIINVGRINKYNKELYCEIKWKPRDNGIQKDNTIVKTKEVKELHPKMLVDFYESKIIFLRDFI